MAKYNSTSPLAVDAAPSPPPVSPASPPTPGMAAALASSYEEPTTVASDEVAGVAVAARTRSGTGAAVDLARHAGRYSASIPGATRPSDGSFHLRPGSAFEPADLAGPRRGTVALHLPSEPPVTGKGSVIGVGRELAVAMRAG